MCVCVCALHLLVPADSKARAPGCVFVNKVSCVFVIIIVNLFIFIIIVIITIITAIKLTRLSSSS